MYCATYRNKRGAVIGVPFIAETREDAARALFAAHAKADVASICNAYRDGAGAWQGNGNDVRWIKRRDLEALAS